MKTVLIIGQIFPEPTSTAMGRRMLQLMHVFKGQGATVVFASAAEKTPYSADLEALGITVLGIRLNDASFDAQLHECAPDVVVFDRFVAEEQYGWRVASQCPSALRILDTEDLHSLRLVRQAAVREGKTFNSANLLLSETAKREIASIYRCDVSLIISSIEIDLLTSVFKVDPSLLQYLPFIEICPTLEEQNRLITYKERGNFISIGNFAHQPNWDGVCWLKQELWPLIRKKLPQAKVLVYGAYSSEKVKQLHNEKEGFIIKGRAANANEVLTAARVLLAPLSYGAGLKGKFIDAMQCGTPSVTTTVGAEGMYGDLPWQGYVTDDVQDFADKAVALYQDERLWTLAQKNGFTILEKQFNAIHATEFVDRINQLTQQFSAHRQQNFIGSMLMHHTLQSTKYMAKWIEEKERLGKRD